MNDTPSPGLLAFRRPFDRGPSVPRQLTVHVPATLGAEARSHTWRELLYRTLGPGPARVLDVGCGDGDVAFLLYRMGYFVHGVDASSEHTRRAQERAENLELPVLFRAAPPDDLPHSARSFDGVVARDPFPAAFAPGPVLLEWYRVLRPGGTALIVSASRDARPDELLRRAGFASVVLRDETLPRRPGDGADALTRAPWFRRILRARASFRVACGYRPLDA